MKYETPELTALMPAINAVQATVPTSKAIETHVQDALDLSEYNDNSPSYMDWED